MHTQAEIEALLERLNGANAIERVEVIRQLQEAGSIVVSPIISFAQDESMSTSSRFWAIQALGEVDARVEAEAKIGKSLRDLISSPVAELRAAAAAAALERYRKDAIDWVEPLLDDESVLQAFWWSDDVSDFVRQLLAELG
jgi:hypothetical protein